MFFELVKIDRKRSPKTPPGDRTVRFRWVNKNVGSEFINFVRHHLPVEIARSKVLHCGRIFQ
ncbi:MAG TPA: hypothetical protein DGO89_09455 [Microcoleaceae bacterium UBA9251]|nr:hypothetical protein [Microcoleaceae cyanobacterium UBA9251]